MKSGLALTVAAGLLLTACSASNPSVTPTTSPPNSSDLPSERSFVAEVQDLQLTFRLEGRTYPSDRVRIQAPPNTQVVDLPDSVQTVRLGQRIGRIQPDAATLAQYSEQARISTVAQSQLLALQARSGQVKAPVAGTLDQDAQGWAILSRGLDAVIPLSPLQVLRYSAFTFNGYVTVETVFGQRRARCQAMWMESSTDNSGQDLHCRIPPDVETASGLPVTLTLEANPLPSVLVVPAIYVGLDADGLNYIVNIKTPDGTRPRKVVVGPTDGVVRVIVSGLESGDELIAIEDPS